MRFRHGAALIRFALAAFALLPLFPSSLVAQDVLCIGDASDREVRALRFQGNATFSADELAQRVITTPSSFTRRLLGRTGTKRCYPSTGLAPDVAALRTWYHNNGFFDTRVDTVVTPAGGNAVDITFRITEGPPMRLDSLTITGLDSAQRAAAQLNDLALKVGGRFGPQFVLADVDSIVTRLRNAGYPRADAFTAYNSHAAEHRAEVTLDAHPGARARFGTIAVSRVGANGPPQIDSAVVIGLLGFRPGQLYSDRAVDAAQRNLYNLGAYRHVDVALDTTFAHGDSLADILVDLREDDMHQIDLEEGWATLDCFRVNAQYTDKNFNDQALHAELTARFSKLGYGSPADSRFTRNNLCYRSEMDKDSIGSSKVNDYIGFSVRKPTIFGTRWSPSVAFYTERRGAYKAYLRTTDVGALLSATRAISLNTPFTVGYSLEHGQTTAPTAILCGLFNQCDTASLASVQKRKVFGVASAQLQKITTDNPINPTRGFISTVEVRTSSPVIASDPSLSFFKTTVDFAWYQSVTRGVTIAARARGGYIRGGSTQAGATLPPPQERLYAGGAQSVRGFQQNELGPEVYLLDRDAFDSVAVNDSTFYLVSKNKAPARVIPGGGNALLVLNGEVRLRDPFFPELLEYVPFVDAGQVWIYEVGKSGLNVPQLLVTPGLALRVFSPVGPIQINVGYNRYPPRAGAAYYPVPVNLQTNQAPLLCVTPPGVAPLFVVNHTVGGLVQKDFSSCPAAYAPPEATNFFRRLAFTLSVSSAF